MVAESKPSAKVDLSACCHLHTANLQVLMAAKPAISNWPEDEKLRAWLEAALPISAETALPADKDKEERRTVDRRKRQRTTAPHKERRKSVSPYIKAEVIVGSSP